MLVRFITAQEGVYEIALEEIRSGQKLTHWMWMCLSCVSLSS